MRSQSVGGVGRVGRPPSLSEGTGLALSLPRLRLPLAGHPSSGALLLPFGAGSPLASASPPSELSLSFGGIELAPTPLPSRVAPPLVAPKDAESEDVSTPGVSPALEGADEGSGRAGGCCGIGVGTAGAGFKSWASAASRVRSLFSLELLDGLILVVLRFSFHLSLVALFEVIFFSLFITGAEDSALIGLVDTYIDSALANCSQWSNTTREFVNIIASAIFNRTLVDQMGARARASRDRVNFDLTVRAWAYMGGVIAIVLIFALASWLRKLKVDVRHLLLENIGLVAVLGVYEYLFFTSVIIKYQAITPDELDAMVADTFNSQCGIL